MTLLTISQAAAELSISVRRMQQLVQEGRVIGVRCECGHSIMIEKRELNAVRMRPVGRPRKLTSK